jgi:DNA methyltransferase 1-associated protein 1
MSDIADMLGIANKAPSGNVASEEAMKIMGEKAKIVKGGKKPKGMSREVFDLLGKDGLVPAIQGNVVAPNFKSKRVNALKGKWVWTPITSSARQNNQPAFFHWIKADQTYVDYPYASFNVKFDAFQYTDEEYEKYLSSDLSWSRADTDELIQVCHRFDMRWPVISDRIELSTPRAVEDMQERYYSVRAAVQAKRMELVTAPQAHSGGALTSSGFNVEQERKRRRAQDMLFKK